MVTNLVTRGGGGVVGRPGHRGPVDDDGLFPERDLLELVVGGAVAVRQMKRLRHGGGAGRSRARAAQAVQLAAARLGLLDSGELLECPGAAGLDLVVVRRPPRPGQPVRTEACRSKPTREPIRIGKPTRTIVRLRNERALVEHGRHNGAALPPGTLECARGVAAFRPRAVPRADVDGDGSQPDIRV